MFKPLLLMIGLTALAHLNAQVGVNNPNPEQSLDVNGKVKVGDDGTTPSPGTIRFNRLAGDFQGYDGTEYKSLTQNSSVAETARSGMVYAFNATPNSAYRDFDQGFAFNSRAVDIANTPAFSTSQYFMVTKIVINANSPTTSLTDSYFVAFSKTTISGGRFNPALEYRFRAVDGHLEITANRVPLLDIGPNQKLTFRNSSSSPGPVRIQVYGVFLDEPDDYFGL